MKKNLMLPVMSLCSPSLSLCLNKERKLPNQIFRNLILLTFFLFLTMNVKAQFTTASVAEYSTYISNLHFKTGNDAFNDTHSSDVFYVSAYDGYSPNHAGFSYRVTSGIYTYANTIPITAFGCDMRNIDVCIVQDPSYPWTVHALVVFNLVDVTYSSNSLLEMHDYEWNGSSFFYSGGSFAISLNSATTDVNIDADSYGNYAIIYDDLYNGINFLSGSISSNMVNLNSYTPFTVGIYGTTPDLTISSYGFNTQTVYFSYIENSLTAYNLQVSSLTFNDIATSNSSALPPSLLLNKTAPNFAFGHPRIASPVGSNTADWTVVVDETNGTRTGNFSYIEGYNSSGGTVGTSPIYYNNWYGDLRSVYNWNPVVTYDAWGQVWVGWNFDNTSGNMTGLGASATAIYPIVVECANDGIPLSSASGYYEVPNATIASYSYINEISLASRFHSDLFLTYFNNGNNSLYIKYLPVATPIGSLKTAQRDNSLLLSNPISKLIRNANTSEKLNLFLYNTSGQLILKEFGHSDMIQNKLKQNMVNLPQSIYVVKIISDDGKINLSEKFFMGQ